MIYGVELIRDIKQDLEPLLYDHWKEIATHKDQKRLNVDWDRYIKMEKAGAIRTFTARDGYKLVGYFVTFIHPHMHYQDCVFAMNDVLYIDPEYRGTSAAYRLIKGAMDDLKDNMGANIVCIHMKTEYPFRELLTKLGFELTEENWERVL